MERSRHVVVFDLGEVLASPTDLAQRLGSCAGVEPDVIDAAYWRHRLPHDEGQSAEEYWGVVLADAGVAPTAALVEKLVEIDTEAWMRIREDAADLLAELQDAHTTVAVLSNMPTELAAKARSTSWAPLIDHWFFSGEMKVAKPSAEIYSRAAHALAVEPEDVVFFDDRQVNVDAATRAGWDAHLWTSGEATRAVLQKLSII